MMDLGFFAADTMGVTLYQTKGTLKAGEFRNLQFGPWRLDVQIDVLSDVLTDQGYGFWVTLNKKLQIYVIVRDSENWLFVLDAKALEEVGAKTGFASTTLKERVLEFKPAIRGAFQWRDSEWRKVQYSVIGA